MRSAAPSAGVLVSAAQRDLRTALHATPFGRVRPCSRGQWTHLFPSPIQQPSRAPAFTRVCPLSLPSASPLVTWAGEGVLLVEGKRGFALQGLLQGNRARVDAAQSEPCGLALAVPPSSTGRRRHSEAVWQSRWVAARDQPSGVQALGLSQAVWWPRSPRSQLSLTRALPPSCGDSVLCSWQG